MSAEPFATIVFEHNRIDHLVRLSREEAVSLHAQLGALLTEDDPPENPAAAPAPTKPPLPSPDRAATVLEKLQ